MSRPRITRRAASNTSNSTTQPYDLQHGAAIASIPTAPCTITRHVADAIEASSLWSSRVYPLTLALQTRSLQDALASPVPRKGRSRAIGAYKACTSHHRPLCAQKTRNHIRAAPRPHLLPPVLLTNRYQIQNAPSPSGIYNSNPTSEPAARTTFAEAPRATSLSSSTTGAFMGPAIRPPLSFGGGRRGQLAGEHSCILVSTYTAS